MSHYFQISPIDFALHGDNVPYDIFAFKITAMVKIWFRELPLFQTPKLTYENSMLDAFSCDIMVVANDVIMQGTHWQGWGQVLFEVLESSTNIFHICKYKYKYK